VNVPLLDLVAQYRTIKDEVLPAVQRVIEAQQFIMGSAIPELEAAVARLSAVPHGIGCASGTDALLLPLRALNLRPGDEVITTPFTFFATAGAIHNAGGTAVFVDVEPDTFNIDPAAVERALTPRTRAILPVHLYGQLAAMERLLAIAQPRRLPVIEDACQAIGARRSVDGAWRMAGELGWVTAYSFFPSKNLGAWGDGGMMVTSDAALAERLRRLRLHGGAKQYHHDEIGTNSRLDTLQAAVLRVKLPRLAEWNRAREAAARRYEELLAQAVPAAGRPTQAPPDQHVWHLYRIECRDAEHRSRVAAALSERGIETGVHYPIPAHRQACYAGASAGAPDLPVSEDEARRTLSLPIFPEITPAQQERVVGALRAVW
jgi:dTDP-4-amino-4,6-dideoxygalactose transaminase